MRRSMPRPPATPPPGLGRLDLLRAALRASAATSDAALAVQFFRARPAGAGFLTADEAQAAVADYDDNRPGRSEEHTSELQSLMRISYAVFCLKKKTQTGNTQNDPTPSDQDITSPYNTTLVTITNKYK